MSAAHSTSQLSRPLAVTFGLVGGLAVVVGLWVFVVSPLLSGDSSSAQEVEIEVDVTTSPEPDTVITAEPLPDGTEAVPLDLGALPVTTYEVFLSRDPFQPVRLDPETSDDDTSGGAGDNGTDDGAVGTGESDDGDGTGSGSGDGDDPSDGTSSDPGDGDAGSGGDDGCTGTDEVICDGHVVTLVEIIEEEGQEQAIIQVDTTLYTVTEGDEFAESFLVLSIDSPCATFLFGDDAFTLCEGDRVLK